MFICNVLLFISLVIMIFSLKRQILLNVRDTPCTFIWGILFLTLFVFLPLVLNCTYGECMGIVGLAITEEYVYMNYSVSVFLSALVYAFTILFSVTYRKNFYDPFRKSPYSIPAGCLNW